jgi:hypothetical protein
MASILPLSPIYLENQDRYGQLQLRIVRLWSLGRGGARHRMATDCVLARERCVTPHVRIVIVMPRTDAS